MSTISEKSTHFSPTTTNSSIKTPFGIEDILYINNNNNNNLPSANKNGLTSEKNNIKSSQKTIETEEFKKILSSER